METYRNVCSHHIHSNILTTPAIPPSNHDHSCHQSRVGNSKRTGSSHSAPLRPISRDVLKPRTQYWSNHGTKAPLNLNGSWSRLSRVISLLCPSSSLSSSSSFTLRTHERPRFIRLWTSLCWCYIPLIKLREGASPADDPHHHSHSPSINDCH